ncbi:hypothetical protein [Sulfidibacter corallicola]|uniref:Uncharacterized protein n=1 Tax=Sulfidibacter corallicola TaxID=2818388 RepID=A0A8A4TSY3_SULCO|nr:hypothetical protein [Sulfidibacter corallicola]QTD52188.1 hypothetical protein J3U87_06905 [Sulfidibacter corallicola]
MEDHRPAGELAKAYRRYECTGCGAELRQYYDRAGGTKAERAKHEGGSPHLECPECAFGDIACTQCGDTLCPQHVRTFEKYATYLPAPMIEGLIEVNGNGVFCPLCFQNALKRYNYGTSKPRRTPRRPFNLPIILALCSLFLIIAIGLRQCGHSPQPQKEPAVEQPSP